MKLITKKCYYASENTIQNIILLNTYSVPPDAKEVLGIQLTLSLYL